MTPRRALCAGLLALSVVGCGAASRPGPAIQEATRPAPVRHVGTEHAVFRGATGCGTERWAVKTGTDPAAGLVNTAPQDSSIGDLTSIQPPLDPTDRVAPTETATFYITATITAIKREDDSDYHLALSDGRGHTMIAESPAPACAQGSVFADQIQRVRAIIDRACPGVGGAYTNTDIPAELTGPGFFDRLHGQRGVAPNGIEIHPLLDIVLHGRC